MMASDQELAEMERMSSDWRPDAPVTTRGYRHLLLILTRLLGTFSWATAVDECTRC